MAWEGVNFFQDQECVHILGCSVTFYEYKNVFLMLVDNVCTIEALFVTKPLHYEELVSGDREWNSNRHVKCTNKGKLSRRRT